MLGGEGRLGDERVCLPAPGAHEGGGLGPGLQKPGRRSGSGGGGWLETLGKARELRRGPAWARMCWNCRDPRRGWGWAPFLGELGS